MLRVRLLEDLEAGRKRGDIVEVAAGYAKSYLIPHGFAEAAPLEEKNDVWDPRELSNADALDRNTVLEEFRRQMYHGGARTWTIRGLNRIFDAVTRDMQDDDGDAAMEPWQFQEAINKFGVFLSADAMRTLERAFDTNGDGRINHTEFLSGLRGPMNERRHRICERAWKYLISRKEPGAQVVQKSDALGSQDQHPLIRSGQASEEEVENLLNDGLEHWTGGDDLVDEQAFMAHFTDMSATIDSDDVFCQMVERQFGVREADESAETQQIVQSFKETLLRKVHEKAREGVTESRTLLDAFRLVNSDSLGSVTLGEFSACMANFGLGRDEQTAMTVFQHFDQSQNNQISYKEFVAAMTK
ncbi:Calcyphosin-like protein [Hondaea fermentalgiana]|uniref:Calcyphosin-like protein n=1 Tax=Hondaea fermentalgiana TaxID=2315210 RepID=A0A2R5GPI0_9STRA|nr:Calcyphosin-like protein [Hondaea fermentalgiana]|eukprot:GBG32525.1 Calcyphosin-like protein [Hondaea fermentalgiana]